MKSIFGVIGLLLALSIMGLVVKRQLGSLTAPAAEGAAVLVPATPPGAGAQQRSDQIQQQYKDSLARAMQQPGSAGAGQ